MGNEPECLPYGCGDDVRDENGRNGGSLFCRTLAKSPPKLVLPTILFLPIESPPVEPFPFTVNAGSRDVIVWLLGRRRDGAGDDWVPPGVERAERTEAAESERRSGTAGLVNPNAEAARAPVAWNAPN